jgi:hypothetical protein
MKYFPRRAENGGPGRILIFSPPRAARAFFNTNTQAVGTMLRMHGVFTPKEKN